MTWTIKKLEKGKRPTLLETDKGNELIKALEALSNITISKGARDDVVYGDDEIAITYGTDLGGHTEEIFISTGTFNFQNGILTNYQPY